MHTLHPVCCGLDIHNASITACLRRVQDDGTVHKEFEDFGTTSKELIRLLAWLLTKGCPIVAMESTGVLWRPIFDMFEGAVEVIVGNAFDMRRRPGDKTDVRDADWISDLLAHGLVRPSFVPNPEQRLIRTLMRLRTTLVQSIAQAKNRVMKMLAQARIKLSTVMSDVFGKSGRDMLDAMAAGPYEPAKVALLARGSMKRKVEALSEALDGCFGEHHRVQLRMFLAQIALFEGQIAEVDRSVEHWFEKQTKPCEGLDTIPGVDKLAARLIISEIGTDMERFGSASRLASWCGMCPSNNESAGKRRRGKARKGNRYLRRVLLQCAWAAARSESFLGNKYKSLKARMGSKKAAMAIGHKILVIGYNILKRGSVYDESLYLDKKTRSQKKDLNRAAKLLKRAGFDLKVDLELDTVTLSPT